MEYCFHPLDDGNSLTGPIFQIRVEGQRPALSFRKCDLGEVSAASGVVYATRRGSDVDTRNTRRSQAEARGLHVRTLADEA